jgi:hypothetical protein
LQARLDEVSAQLLQPEAVGGDAQALQAGDGRELFDEHRQVAAHRRFAAG